MKLSILKTNITVFSLLPFPSTLVSHVLENVSGTIHDVAQHRNLGVIFDPSSPLTPISSPLLNPILILAPKDISNPAFFLYPYGPI